MLAAILAAVRPGGCLLVMQSSPRGLIYEFNEGLSPGANAQSDDITRVGGRARGGRARAGGRAERGSDV